MSKRGGSSRQQAPPDLTEPLLDASGQHINELHILDEDVIVTWAPAAQVNDPQYAAALERMARRAAAHNGYDAVQIT
jgi:hypothetical protein